jgi:rubrerythrin
MTSKRDEFEARRDKTKKVSEPNRSEEVTWYREKLHEIDSILDAQRTDESDAGVKYQELASLMRKVGSPELIEMAKQVDEIAANEFGHLKIIREMIKTLAKELEE